MKGRSSSGFYRVLAALVVAGLALSLSGARGIARAQARGTMSQPAPGHQLPTDRLIVKYRAGSQAGLAPKNPGQIRRLNAAAGTSFSYLRGMSGDAHVLRLPAYLPAAQVQALSARLMRLPEVEYAEPDARFLPALLPNDPYFGNQWDLYGTWGINAPGAWDITTGSSSVVVADIDTGLTSHSEFSGRTIPGYDFIGDIPTANDGNGRDADPRDPGDWVTYADTQTKDFSGCLVENSSWHGTHTAGTLGATGNNGVGVAGIDWHSRILVARVLGKCGGYTSDIADAIRWSAGGAVSGVPANANPARVLNLSLESPGTCGSAMQSAINSAVAAGAVVVAAAGNDSADASGYSPANCVGAVAVTASGSDGNRASYSNFGSTVDISAPGGTSSGGILSTLNTGTTVPVADNYVYYVGTSMAAPHVVGVISLMLSVYPGMTPAQIIQMLESTATAFPSGGNCNTSTCGAGLLNAQAAVYAAAHSPYISGNAGFPGATLSFYDGGNKSITADASGNYSLRVSYNWSGTVTVSYPGLSFTPALHSYDNLTSDLTGENFSLVHLFSDVPVAGKEWMEPWIDSFYYTGITTGCGSAPLIYCPENNVTRAEMAVFLLRARHGAGYQPPAKSHFFSDMPVTGKQWMEPWVDEYYREGLTTGCGTYLDGLHFCPENNVTRAEMAVFVLRATHASGWVPPASTGVFTDVPVSGQEWMQPWIEAYYHAGITTGCNPSPLQYCPLSYATRAEMAVFLDRAFHLYP